MVPFGPLASFPGHLVHTNEAPRDPLDPRVPAGFGTDLAGQLCLLAMNQFDTVYTAELEVSLHHLKHQLNHNPLQHLWFHQSIHIIHIIHQP